MRYLVGLKGYEPFSNLSRYSHESGIVLSRIEIRKFFEPFNIQPNFLNFETRFEISNSTPIRNREKATSYSFNQDSIEKIAGLEGSPSFETILSTIKVLKNSGILPELSGIGVEVGSGIGLLSAACLVLDKKREILGIIAVEASLPFVQTGINLTREEILKEDAFRLLPCYGSFDSMDIENETIDFVIQIEALHHADALHPPISESLRILRTGGYFISIDRSWPDNTNSESLIELLDHEYPKNWLIEKGFPSDAPFTRRNNGEHEYLDSQWKDAFRGAGFQLQAFVGIHPSIKPWQLVKRFIGLLGLQNLFSIKIPSRSGVFRALFFQHFPKACTYLGGQLVVKHPRQLTVSIWKK